MGLAFYGSALLLVEELGLVREFVAHSLFGAALDDEAVRAETGAFFQGPMGWKTEDGYCCCTLDSHLLAFRGLTALVDEDADSDASRAALRAWLPPTDELVRIVEYEVGWLAQTTGAAHPGLLCARLHGERLGDWQVTVEVAEAVLRVEQFQPLLRAEALRLLGRAKGALDEPAAAREAAERAAAEAAGARYVWVEVLALRDLLKWCGTERDGVAASYAESVRERLRSAAGRLAASPEEVAAALGKDAVL